MEVLIDAYKLELESMTNYFAIKAFDYFNQESTVSNVVTVQFDLKPSRIRTLKATLLEDGYTFEITFTATGEDMMNGTGIEINKSNYLDVIIQFLFDLTDFFSVLAAFYELRYSNYADHIVDESAWVENDLIGDSNIVSGSLIPQEAGTEMKVVIDGNTLELETLMVFMAIKAYDAANHASDLSNIVAITLELGSLQ